LFHLKCIFFKLKTNIKINTRQFLKHRYLHALAKLATAEGIELRSLSSRIRNLNGWECFI